MSWQLLRGLPVNPQVGSQLIISSEPIPTELGLASLLWHGQPAAKARAWLDQGQGPSPLPVMGDSQQCHWQDEAGTVYVFGQLPWGVLPELEPLLRWEVARVLYLPLIAWQAEQWFDGPLIWIEAGQLRAYVLPGVAARLTPFEAPVVADFASWLTKNRSQSWKQSLAAAVRSKLTLDDNYSYLIQTNEISVREALVLLGLRLAYPNVSLFWFERPSSLEAQWRRYSQNLNIATWAEPTQVAAMRELPINDLAESWTKSQSQVFFHELCLKIPFVPEKLLASWL